MSREFDGVKVVMALVSLLAGATAMAQTTKPAGATTRAVSKYKSESAMATEIQELLSSADAASRQQAVELIRGRVATRGVGDLRSTWMKLMMGNKMYKEVAGLAREGILAGAAETRAVESALQYRIKAMLALGQAEAALVEAKSLFNVASMVGTSETILLVAECINVARPNDKEVFNRFRQEQMAGVTMPTTQAVATTPAAAVVAPKCAVLAGIKVDAGVYAEAIRQITGEDAPSLMARGNLLLLADRVKESREVFDRMYTLSSAEAAEVSEALARCIKAEDGTVGRANAFVLSIRPARSWGGGGGAGGGR